MRRLVYFLGYLAVGVGIFAGFALIVSWVGPKWLLEFLDNNVIANAFSKVLPWVIIGASWVQSGERLESEIKKKDEAGECSNEETQIGFSQQRARNLTLLSSIRVSRKWVIAIIAFGVASFTAWILIPVIQNSSQNQLLEQLMTTDKDKVRRVSQKGEYVVFEMLPESGLRGTGAEHKFPLEDYKDAKARLNKAQEDLRKSQRLPLRTKVKLTTDRNNLSKGIRSGMIGIITNYSDDFRSLDYDYLVTFYDEQLPDGSNSCFVYGYEVMEVK